MYELRAILADDPGLKPWERISLLAGEDEPDAPAVQKTGRRRD